MKKKLFLAVSFCLFILPLFSQNQSDLVIGSEDMYIVPGDEKGPSKNGAGYHLYIKKKPGIESVMMVESAKDPDGKQTNYAYRATEYNTVNGDEKRYLNGELLVSETSKYSLIDSTAEYNNKFGQAFHIYIPETIVFGYPWSRNGVVHVKDGFYVNIRTFSKKYADYTGKFCDNSFIISERNAAYVRKSDNSINKTVPKSTFLPAEEKTAEQKPAGNSVPLNIEIEEQIASLPFVEESGIEKNILEEDLSSYFSEIPSENAFIEEDEYYVEEIKVTELEVQEPEIPEDERDPISEQLFDEYAQTYYPSKLGKAADLFNELTVPASQERKPAFRESMEGVDPDFVKKLEAEEEYKRKLAEAEAEAAKYEEIPNYERPDLGSRFITHDIEMIKVEGSGNIKTLYISRTEVTQRSYMEVMGINPSKIQGDFLPVESVSWYDVLVFCNLLSMRDGLVPCYTIKGARNPGSWGPIPKESKSFWNSVECDYKADGYRMLTVEEWEYAAKGGIFKDKTSFAGSNVIDDVAWYKDNSEETTHPVGYKYQNSCGLYDMSGNVSEWCMGFTGNSERSAQVRGGNYTCEKKNCKISYKDACQPWYAHFGNGIRICRNIN